MSVYFTSDADAHKIAERADIREAATEAEALAELRRGFMDGDFEVAGMERGSFSDCWVKFVNRPTPDDLARLEREAGPLHVAAPGTHPGGRFWWITPASVIFVPVLKLRPDVAD